MAVQEQDQQMEDRRVTKLQDKARLDAHRAAKAYLENEAMRAKGGPNRPSKIGVAKFAERFEVTITAIRRQQDPLRAKQPGRPRTFEEHEFHLVGRAVHAAHAEQNCMSVEQIRGMFDNILSISGQKKMSDSTWARTKLHMTDMCERQKCPIFFTKGADSKTEAKATAEGYLPWFYASVGALKADHPELWQTFTGL